MESSPIAEGRVAEIYALDSEKILKLSRDWVPSDWLEYEYQVARVVYAAGMRSPEPIELRTQEGRTGIVYERIEGEPMLTQIGGAPQKVGHFGRLMGRTHAEMHTKFGAPDLPDNLDRLRRKIESVEGAPEDVKQAALDRLKSLPTGEDLPGGQRLLHGDFHPGNILLSEAEEAIVIDWPDASRGHPLGDVARTVVIAQLGGLPRNKIIRILVKRLRDRIIKSYLKSYFRASPFDSSSLDDWIFPVLFARLSEDIETERSQSIDWLRKLHQGGKSF